MKNKKLIAVIAAAVVLLLVTGAVLLWVFAPKDSAYAIVVEGELADGTVIEYTGEKIQFPVAHIADGDGNVISYDVEYKVVNLSDNSESTNEYANFDLNTGSYQIVYSYKADPAIFKTVSFAVQDTTDPVIEFIDIPNGLFLQDITEDTVNKLPLYVIGDASSGEGIDLIRKLKIKGEGDEDFREYTFR